MTCLKMSQKERANFYRFSTRIVDHTKEAYVDLIDLHLSNNNLSFEDFINQNQHDIYHFCYNRGNCCQCSPGFALPPSRVLHPPQLDVLLDKHGPTLPSHRSGRWTNHCCRKAKSGLRTDVLDVTLARFILINFCQDVFWYSCLAYQSLTLDGFLNKNKHDLYHMFRGNIPCCVCLGGYVFPVQKPILSQNQWSTLFGSSVSPCNLHMHMPSPITICCVAATAGINVTQIDASLTRIILEHVCALRKAIDTLIQLRNEVYGHAKEAKISDTEYNAYSAKADSALLHIARICGKETDLKQKLSDLEKRPLDETLLIHYQTQLLEQKKSIDDVKDEINTRIQHIESRVDIIEKLAKTQSKSSPDNDAEKRRKALQEMTEASVKAHIKEGTFVSTNSVVVGMDSLMQFGVALVIGHPGAGKSRIGLELLSQYTKRFSEYICLQLHDFTEWGYLLKVDDKCIVFLDDIFGKTNLTYNNNRDYKYIDIISTYVQIGNVKVVITSRENLKQKSNRLFLSHRLFTNIPEINLGSDIFGMTKDEKRQCLVNYFERNKIEETEDKEKENMTHESTINNSIKVYVHSETINDIVDLEPSPILGFPESCFLFASNRRFTRQSLSFFRHANAILCEEISELREKGKTDHESMFDYVILVYVFLNGDRLDLEFIKFDQVTDLQSTIYSFVTVPINIQNIHYSVKRLSRHLLKKKYDFKPEVFCFQHRTIFEAVALSCVTLKVEKIIKSMDFDFILEFARPETYTDVEGEVSYTIPKRMYNVLAHRLLVCLRLRSGIFYSDIELQASKFENVTLWDPFHFTQRLCDSLIIKLTGTHMINHLCQIYNLLRPNIIKQWVDCYDMDLPERGDLRKRPSRISLSSFDLPVAMLMFLDDSNDVLSYLANEIHKVLSSKHKAYCYIQCKRAVIETFIYACLSCDTKKAKLLWQIIKSHRIQIFRVHDLIDFRNKVILGIRTILYNASTSKMLMEIVDDYSLFDLNVFQSELLFLYGANNMIVSLLQSRDPLQFDVLRAIQFACYVQDLQCLKFLLTIYEQREIDFGFAMRDHIIWSDSGGLLVEIVKLFAERFGERIITWGLIAEQAVKNSSKVLMQFVLEKIDKDEIDLKSLMRKSWHLNSDFLSYLLETFADEQIDITTVFDHACTAGDRDRVQSLLVKNDHGLFDMSSAILNTCGRYNVELCNLLLHIYKPTKLQTMGMMEDACEMCSKNAIEFLLENFDYDVLNIQEAINTACRRDSIDDVRFLFNRFGYNKFDISSAFFLGCRGGGVEMIKMFLKTFDHANLDIKAALTVACRNRNIFVLMFLLENIEYNLLDANLMIIEACRSGNKEKVQFLFELFESKMFDINSGIQNACLSGNHELVLYLRILSIKEKLDFKPMVEMACRSGNVQTIDFVLNNGPKSAVDINYAFGMACLSGKLPCVRYLLEQRNFKEFDMPFAMNMACLSREVKVIHFLLDNFKDRSFNVTSAMNNACLSESSEPIRYLTKKYPSSLFNLKDALNMACLKRNNEGVKYLLGKFDLKLFEMTSAFNNACSSGSYKIVLLLLEKMGPSSCDLSAALNSACSNTRIHLLKMLPDNYFDSYLDYDLTSGKLKVINFLFGSFEHSKFDMRHAFCEACSTGTLKIVQLFVTSVDRTRLDITSAMNRACKSGNKEIVELLYAEFGIGAFDMQSALRKARHHGHTAVLAFLRHLELSTPTRQRHKTSCTIS